MEITLDVIMPLVALVVSAIFGWCAKKWKWYESKYIPYQNVIIGVASAILYCTLVEEANLVIAIITALSGLTAGGGYDLIKTEKEE